MTILRRTEMITEEYLKDNFLTAHFIDNERKKHRDIKHIGR